MSLSIRERLFGVFAKSAFIAVAFAWFACFSMYSFMPVVTSPKVVSAESVGDTDYTMSLATSTNQVDMSIGNINGVTVSSHDITASITCPAGYSLMINSVNDSRLYRNDDIHSEYFIQPATGTISKPAELGVNQWGFALSDNNKFSGAPLDPSTIKTVQTDIEADKTKVYYGVKVDNTLASGHYVGSVVYSVMGNPDCFKYTVKFNEGGAGAIGAYGPLSVGYGSKINVLTASTYFSKPDHTLVGWMDQEGTFYKPDLTSVDVNPYNSDEVTMVAIWGKNSITDFFEATTMQDMTPALCATATTPYAASTMIDTTGRYKSSRNYIPQVTLVDSRDGTPYTVRKYADGNCWMAENLRIVGPRTLTIDDSDVVDPFDLPASDNGRWAISATDESSANTPHVYYPSNRYVGGYYNWYTAVAGSKSYKDVNLNAPGSICPKGWQLPRSTVRREDETKSYKKLLADAYGLGPEDTSKDSQLFDLGLFGFIKSGYYELTGRRDIDNGAYYWTSSAIMNGTNPQAMYMGLNRKENETPSNGYSGMMPKVNGLSVRCVAY